MLLLELLIPEKALKTVLARTRGSALSITGVAAKIVRAKARVLTIYVVLKIWKLVLTTYAVVKW